MVLLCQAKNVQANQISECLFECKMSAETIPEYAEFTFKLALHYYYLHFERGSFAGSSSHKK